MLSRSFKYHRPRGVLTMAGHDANTLVQVAEEPNVRADQYALAERHRGEIDQHARDARSRSLCRARSPVAVSARRLLLQDVLPARLDVEVLGEADPGARGARHGSNPKAHHKYYDKAYLFADVLVVGGGPAGLNAAIAAAEAGAETLLVDEWPELGGSLLYGRSAGNARGDGRGAQGARCQGARDAEPDFDDGDDAVRGSLPTTGHRQSRATASTRSARSIRSSRAGRSISRWSSPTTTGRASCSRPRRSV